ncbi:unnamed protein product [Psylliodes chrysocephalus]|uniref:ZAD domain-containing protein n=1 Tax=Psylliodes chrysocephalus TaxID=3402493 RepID=A0A9P0CRI3_9CUCU|nr:unnamed protein product [Psylliodes chrysocephala]
MLVAAFDFPNICRICLDKGDLKPLDENTIELIEIITDVNVKSESDFPKNICSKCIKDLMDISIFMDKMKYNNMLLKFVLLNPQITIKQEPLEEMFCIPRIEVNKTEPANTIEQTSILRNLLNYENFQKEDRQQNSVSTGYKFDKNNVKSFKENNYCVCSKMQCTECEHGK